MIAIKTKVGNLKAGQVCKKENNINAVSYKILGIENGFVKSIPINTGAYKYYFHPHVEVFIFVNKLCENPNFKINDLNKSK